MSEGVTARALAAGYGHKTVFAGLDFDAAGGLTQIVGPNGCGKSLFLSVCAGLVAPFAGELSVAGADPASGAARDRVRFVPTEPPLFPELTVSQHVALFGHIRPESAHRLESRIEQYRLTPFVDVVVAELSTGNRQKASIILNTMGGSFGDGSVGLVYLLDEPFNGLDAGSAEVLSGEMRAWAHEGATVIYTHHEQGQPADGVLSLGARVFDLAAATSGNGVTSPALPAEG